MSTTRFICEVKSKSKNIYLKPRLEADWIRW
nr:MAG TPA_asm: hypothetical protein [Caudoviricetes sp.]